MNAPRYRSTRAPEEGSQGGTVAFSEALLQGLAPDGGLFVPDGVPALPDGVWASDALPDLAAAVLAHWIDDLDDLGPLLSDALDFPIPVVPLSRDRYVLELFHGPTQSFKDVGARTMARLVARYLRRAGERLTVLVATSGDTGSAVADGFAGQDGIEVVLLYPKGRVSALQERQLTVARPGVWTYAVDGTFDDCQRLVKEAFVDPALAGRPLSSANSINVGRLLPQSLYYLWGSRSVARLRGGGNEPQEPLTVCVPSGNLGNLTGGLLASRMGLPVRRFVAAHNANRYFPDFLQRAVEPFRFPATVATLSNAMDVGAPSNFERLYVLLGGSAAERVHGESVNDDATRARVRRTWREEGYLACPHTAVGLEALDRYRAASGDEAPALVLATAHPAKFADTLRDTLRDDLPSEGLEEALRSEALEALDGRPTRVASLPPRLEALRDALLALP